MGTEAKPATTTAAAPAAPALPATVTDASKATVTVTSVERIVTLLGSNTETVYALGLGDNIVGVDVTSQFPPEVTSKPQVGNFSAITPEPVLAQKPTLVIAPALPPTMAALEPVRAAGIPVVFVSEAPELATAEQRIRLIADAVGLPERGDELIAELSDTLATAVETAGPAAARLRAIYLTYRNNQLSVFGQGSAPYALVRELGAINVVDELGVKTGPMTAEALIAAKPDVIFFPQDVAATLGGVEGFAALPGVSSTPAATSGQLYAVDATMAQSLGPRAGDALAEMVAALATAKPAS